MAYADLDTILDLWDKTREVFSAKAEAIGGIALSGTSLVASTVSGVASATVELASTFAQRSQAARYVDVSGDTVELQDADGNTLDSATLYLPARIAVECDANKVTVSLYDGYGTLISSDYDFVTQ